MVITNITIDIVIIISIIMNTTIMSAKLSNKSLRKKQYVSYIERRIDRKIPVSYLDKKQVIKVAKYVGFYHEIESNENIDDNRKVGGKIKLKKNKKRIVGKGISEEPKKIIFGKFSVNMDKLKNNILYVQYTSCRGTVPSLRHERISDDVKSVITDILDRKSVV